MYERYDELVEYIKMLIENKPKTPATKQKTSGMVNLRFGTTRLIFLSAYDDALKAL